MTKVSVIIPVFNAAKTIAMTLDSVRNQNFSGTFEVFVIDDGSTDHSSNVIQNYQQQHPDFHFTLISQENKGVSSARNAGLKLATGDYIAFLDADDVWNPEKTEKQLQVFNNPRLTIDFLATARNNKKLLFPYIPGKNNLARVTFRKLLFRNEITVPSVIFRKGVLKNTGYFDENRKYAEDVDFWLRISEHNQMYILGESLVTAGGGKRTFGVSGLSSNLRGMHCGFLQNLRKMCLQHRISKVEYAGYFLFYKLKYIVLLIRNFWYKLKS